MQRVASLPCPTFPKIEALPVSSTNTVFAKTVQTTLRLLSLRIKFSLKIFHSKVATYRFSNLNHVSSLICILDIVHASFAKKKQAGARRRRGIVFDHQREEEKAHHLRVATPEKPEEKKRQEE